MAAIFRRPNPQAQVNLPRQGHPDGMGRAELFGLLDDDDLAVALARVRGHLFAAVTHDENSSPRVQLGRRGQRMGKQRCGADLVQHLRKIRVHACALAGGE